MDKNLEKKLIRGRKRSDLVANRPFSISLHSILRERGLSNSALDKMAGLGNGVVGKILRSGNPTLDTAWALEDALKLPRGALYAPLTPTLSQAEKRKGNSELEAAIAAAVREHPTVKANVKARAIPFPAGARRAANLDERPVRGLAAADASGGTRIPDTDEQDDPYRFPEMLMLIPVVGDSMSPVVLDGQYVEIDAEREGFEGDNGIYVVSVLEPDPGDDYPEPMTGTFVKRCVREENLYYLKSVNTYSPFSVHVDHCRMWPVLGIWFGDKGSPPEGF